MNKRQRQQIERRVLKDRPIANQRELMEELAALGCQVTQATVSRDVRDIGMQKSRDHTGRVRYVLVPNTEERPDRPTACGRMLREFGRGLDVAQNLLVLHCDPGAAPSVARAIDELDHELIIGSVAGDDTVVLVTKDTRSAESVRVYLTHLGG